MQAWLHLQSDLCEMETDLEISLSCKRTPNINSRGYGMLCVLYRCCQERPLKPRHWDTLTPCVLFAPQWPWLLSSGRTLWKYLFILPIPKQWGQPIGQGLGSLMLPWAWLEGQAATAWPTMRLLLQLTCLIQWRTATDRWPKARTHVFCKEWLSFGFS